MRHKHLYGLIFALFFVGFSIFCYRHWVLDVPITEHEHVNTWTVEATLHFVAEKHKPVKASFFIPYMPPNFAILDEYFISHNYGVNTELDGNNRRAIWALRRSVGPQALYYRAIFRETESSDTYLSKPKPFEVAQVPEHVQTAIDTIASQAKDTSADTKTFAQSIIKALHQKNGNAKILVGSEASDQNIVKAAILLFNNVKIHAIAVKCLRLKQQYKADFKLLIAVYADNKWVYLNPKTSNAELPREYLIWQYGDDKLYSVSGGKAPQFNITISPTPVNALTIAKTMGAKTDSQLMRFSLLQLPVHVQETYKTLLTVPIGAFVILILRNFVGLVTFGTFMPVLIALAFRETHVIWGLFLFTIIVSFGLLVRFYLDQLRLLLVPRLAAVLTVVILFMIFISILSQSLGLESGLSVALFPMVILTMTIERMCITWDERGPYEAIKSGAGSLIAAVIAYGAMNIATLQYLLFAFPELLLVLLAIILWFGQYRGYRLTELFRFKALARQE